MIRVEVGVGVGIEKEDSYVSPGRYAPPPPPLPPLSKNLGVKCSSVILLKSKVHSLGCIQLSKLRVSIYKYTRFQYKVSI